VVEAVAQEPQRLFGPQAMRSIGLFFLNAPVESSWMNAPSASFRKTLVHFPSQS
jgi:hypothetical protein